MGLLTIVQVLQSLWIFFIVFMLFVKFRVGVAGYLAYIFLVPYMKIEIGEYSLQWNFINLLLLLAFILHRQQYLDKHKKYDWRPLMPFVFYFGVSLLLMPFQDGMPFSESLNMWRTHAMKYIILPFVIWNDILDCHKSLKLYRNVTIGCIIIAVLYGLFLTAIPGINPYMMLISAANGEEFDLAYAAGNGGVYGDTTLNEGRLFGRISSVFAHPMTFALFLGMALFYLYRNKENLPMWLIGVMSLCIMTNIIVCGVRSVIGAMFFSLLFLLIKSRNVKFLLIASICGCFLLSLTLFSPSLKDYLGSIVDFESSHTSGSSIELRISQLKGCFEEVQYTYFEGNGYGWTGYYISQYESHPTILKFESLIFVILCNSGIFGMILWLAMSAMIIKFNKCNERSIAILLNSLFVFYIVYACITGEYGYMQYFIIFYILMLGENLYEEHTDIDGEKQPDDEEQPDYEYFFFLYNTNSNNIIKTCQS